MTRPRNSVKDRRECFDRFKYVDALGRTVMDCHICGGVVAPSAGDKWEADHVVPLAWDGTDVRPAHTRCHKQKTAKKDIPAIAKGKRIYERHYGIRRAKGFYKPKGAKFDWSRGRYVREEVES